MGVLLSLHDHLSPCPRQPTASLSPSAVSFWRALATAADIRHMLQNLRFSLLLYIPEFLLVASVSHTHQGTQHPSLSAKSTVTLDDNAVLLEMWKVRNHS